MPKLSPKQFKAQFMEAGMAWVLNSQQQLINEKGERQHGITQEKSGQLRWTQGNFESRKSRQP